MSYSYKDRVKILSACQSLSALGRPIDAFFWVKVVEVLSELDNTATPEKERIWGDDDDSLEEIIDLRLCHSSIPLCGADKGFGAFEVEYFSPNILCDAQLTAQELMGMDSASFSEQEFCSLFGEGAALQDTEAQDELILRKGGVFDALSEYDLTIGELENPVPDGKKLDMVKFFLEGSCYDVDYENGYSFQEGYVLHNRFVDAWLHFIPRGFVSKRDAEKGGKLLGRLIADVRKYSTETVDDCVFFSYGETDAELTEGDSTGRTFEARVIIADSDYALGEMGMVGLEFLAMGIMPPEISLALVQVQHFLQQMEGKYHFMPGKKGGA